MTVFEVVAERTARLSTTHGSYRSWRSDRLRAVVTADTVAAGMSGILAAYAAGSLGMQGLSLAGMALVASFALAWPVLCGVSGGYAHSRIGSAAAECAVVARVLAVLFAVTGAAVVVIGHAPPRAVALPAVATLAVAAVLGRALVAHLFGRQTRRVLLLGPEARLREAAERLIGSRYGTVVAGIVPEGGPQDLLLKPGVPLLRDVDRLDTAIELVAADTVVIAAGALTSQQLRDISWRLEDRGVEVAVLPGVLDVDPARMLLRTDNGLSILAVAPPSRDGVSVLLKHAVDRVAAGLALLLLLPVLLAVMVAIRCTSAGPAVFRQQRIGKDGRPFVLYKFRTMVADAESRRNELMARNDADGPLFKLRNDPRVTPVGRFLRRHSLDELPQLINVVRGEMSLVGPRPPLPSEVAGYTAEAGRRLMVRPGMTGLWQVSGRSDLSWNDAVRLDLSYVDNLTLRRDIDILRRTVGTVLGGRGAY